MLVEYAFASSFLLLLFFGILDFGRAAYDYHLVGNAARLGARYAIVHGANSCATTNCTASKDKIEKYVQSVSAGLDVSQLSVTDPVYANTTACRTTSGAGCLATVTVSYPFTFVYVFPAFTMTSSSKMTVSQ